MDRESDENLPKVLSVLDQLTEEELVQLNHVIVARIRLMQQIRSHGQMMNFRLGRRARFTSSRGEPVRGVITRHNRKSVTLVADNGVQWRSLAGNASGGLNGTKGSGN